MDLGGRGDGGRVGKLARDGSCHASQPLEGVCALSGGQRGLPKLYWRTDMTRPTSSPTGSQNRGWIEESRSGKGRRGHSQLSR